MKQVEYRLMSNNYENITIIFNDYKRMMKDAQRGSVEIFTSRGPATLSDIGIQFTEQQLKTALKNKGLRYLGQLFESCGLHARGVAR